MYTVDMISKKYSAQGSTPSKTWIFATEKICLTSRGFDLNLCTVDSTKKKKNSFKSPVFATTGYQAG